MPQLLTHQVPMHPLCHAPPWAADTKRIPCLVASPTMPSLPAMTWSHSSHSSEGTGCNWTRKAYGAVDAKVVDLHSFRSRTTHVICGPTADDQAPFEWSTAAFPAVMHEGLADE
ncbi:phospholipase B-like, partial [Haematococcus lacustris]